VAVRNAILSRKRGKIFNKIEQWRWGGLVTLSFAVMIYRPKKGKGGVNDGLGPW
jgi:hypothetical protein